MAEPSATRAKKHREQYQHLSAEVKTPFPVSWETVHTMRRVIAEYATGVEDARELMAMFGVLPDESGAVAIYTVDDAAAEAGKAGDDFELEYSL